MVHPGKSLQCALAIAFGLMLASYGVGAMAQPTPPTTPTPAEVNPAPGAANGTPAVANTHGTTPDPANLNPAPSAGDVAASPQTASQTAASGLGAQGVNMAQFTAGILASMDGGPRVWQSADALIPDFAQLNAAIGSPEAEALHVRVAIWGQDHAAINAEDVATSLGQSLGGTVITISPASIGVYAATQPDAVVEAAVANISGQVAGEANPATIVTTLVQALTNPNQAATGTGAVGLQAGGNSDGGLLMPLVVGLAIVLGGGGWWLLRGRKLPQGFGQSGPRANANHRSSEGVRTADGIRPSGDVATRGDNHATPGRGTRLGAKEPWGIRLNRFLAGRTRETQHDEAALDDREHEDSGVGEPVDQADYARVSPPRRIAAEVIGIEHDGPHVAPSQPQPGAAARQPTPPDQPQRPSPAHDGPSTSTAAAYGKVAARTKIDQIAQQIVVLSPQVAQTRDLTVMTAFEQAFAQYTEAKGDLHQAERPVDLINLNDKLASIAAQLTVLERRISP